MPKKDRDYYYYKGFDYFQKLELNKAVECFQKCLEIDPTDARSVSQIALASQRSGNNELAEKLLYQALQLNQTDYVVLNNTSKFYVDAGRHDLAEKFMFHAYENLNENEPSMRSNFGLSLIRMGFVQEGFDLWENRHETARKMSKALTGQNPRYFKQPLWDGSSLIGKKMIVWTEQGLGDQLIYGTMLKELEGHGGEIYLETVPRLYSAFKRSFPKFNVIEGIDEDAEKGKTDFHYQCSIVSLARIFRNRINKFPDQSSFLIPDEDLKEKWQTRLNEMSDKPKIGVAWRSMKMSYERNANYARIDELEPILKTENVDFINLQYGYQKSELTFAEENFGTSLKNWPDLDLIFDIEDVIALTSCLDAVVSPDSTAGAISGALGQKTYQFNPSLNNCLATLSQKRHMWFPKNEIFASEQDPDELGWKPAFSRMAEKIKGDLNLSD